MKAIILAAGKGTRLKKYTEFLPKGMLQFAGKPLIQRQIETMRGAGVDDITIVTGYQADRIGFEGVNYAHNETYATSNMVESLFCARDEMVEDIIVAYADVICEQRVIKELIEHAGDIVVAVDDEWKEYWVARYDRSDCDLETLSIDTEKNIVELGSECSDPNIIDSRYVGLIKFSKNGIESLKNIHTGLQANYGTDIIPKYGRNVANLYMTDVLLELIHSGSKVKAHNINKGWLEFDTNEDYDRMVQLSKNGELQKLINLEG